MTTINPFCRGFTLAPAPTHRAGAVKKRRAVRVLSSAASSLFFLIAVGVFLFLAVGPRIFGYQTSTMLTGSMAPMISPGDVVVSVPVPSSMVKVGDVITYGIPVDDRRIETHRVVEVISDGGITAVRTQGDANPVPDPWVATLQADTVHVQVATVPRLGTAIRALREPMISKILMYGAPALVVIMLLRSIWRKPGTRV